MRTIISNFFCMLVVAAMIPQLLSCQGENYCVEGICKSEYYPADGKITMCSLSFDEKDGLKPIKTVPIEKDGKFQFRGYIDKPQIVILVSYGIEKQNTENEPKSVNYHAMYILEPGNIYVDCKEYQRNRTYVDCVGSGTELNDKVNAYYQDYSKRWKVLSEKERKQINYGLSSEWRAPIILSHIEKNKDNYAGIFMAFEYLYLNEDVTLLPEEIQRDPFIKSVIEEKGKYTKNETDYDMNFEEEIISIE
ncbi:DUF4369 domain-containing protein [uncultured Bacteroides sp.]|uniref:DUF4369 domain-containing protein n=1 Tax=uncultured Bacteroides sp. TaxID=162156 RepID=UPI0025D59157|nr:DUF4369 domain-containing protein [uncultured Bacteroides sp.]